ncbi:MAG: hypothetical protein P4L69_16480 [Desulfosporosinus sp.]|nr:hypothetical protein [Desulfosporosinus sp.]
MTEERSGDRSDQVIEERKVLCSVVSKIVSIIIYRLKPVDELGEGEIVGFHCHSSSSNCESRCTYKYFMEDF